MSEYYDISLKIGPQYSMWESNPPAWPMYSYERPASMLWNALARGLHDRGWSDDEVQKWLQSKAPRWALDGTLGEALTYLGTMYAAKAEKVAD